MLQTPNNEEVRQALDDLNHRLGRKQSATRAYILAAMRANANDTAFTIQILAEHMTQQGWVNPVQTIRRVTKDFVEFGLIYEMK